jgi:hypothetical protein
MQNDTTKNPTPAPGQVWQAFDFPPGVIARVEGIKVFWADATPWAHIDDLAGPCWRCIGVETPAGRVMVGERRALNGGVFVTERILDGGFIVQVSEQTGVEQGWRPHATEIAHWPLVADPAPADPYRQPYKPERPVPPPPKGPQPKPVNVPERRAYATADDLANALDPTAFGITNGLWDWDRASVRDFKMPIPFAMASGPRMPMPEVTATAQKACGCWVCKMMLAHEQRAADASKMIAEWHAKPMSQEDADRLAERLHVKMNPRPSAPLLSIPFAVDPRTAREQRRREIDAVLREDARRFPAFATARRAAVMAAEEGHRPHLNQLPAYLDGLRAYENAIAKGMRPARAKQEIPGVSEWVEWGWCAVGFTAYERARAMP